MLEIRIPIVDLEDQVIGLKPRSELIAADDIYRVSALWVLNERGEVLLARRSRSKSHDPGRFGTAAAGTVEEGESYEENMHKEAEEELGLTGIDLNEGPKEYVEGTHRFFCQWFWTVVSSDTQLRVQKEEVEEVLWISVAELRNEVERNPGEFLPEMRRYLEALPELVLKDHKNLAAIDASRGT